MSAFSGWPTWVVLIVFSSLFLLIMFGARLLLARRTHGQRQEELSDLAGSLNGPVGATLAFLVGFAVSITWTTMSTAQTDVERLAAQAQQTALLAGGLADRSASATLSADLVAYLSTIAEKDSVVLASVETTEMPSFPALEKLQADVTTLVRSDTAGQDATTFRSVQADIVTMAGTQAELNAVARRGLPDIVLQLLLLTGCLSAATVGMLAVRVHRPYLIVGWAFVIAMGLTVVIAIYNPFGGSVSITFDPLLDAAARIR